MNFAIPIALALHVAQTGQTHLSDYLASQPQSTTPVIVVDPENTPNLGDGNTLAAFNRKLVRLGTLSAIVPTEMTVVNDNLPEPDIYDGADDPSKILFLLAAMTDAQYKIATTTGVSEGDLTGQCRAALHSLFKKPIEYYDQGAPGSPSVTLSPDQMSQVRLHLFRAEKFRTQRGTENAFRIWDPHESEYRGKSPLRHASSNPSNGALFGFQPTSVQANVPKTSALTYAALTQTISLPPKATVGELLKELGQQVGKSIFADPRVAALTIHTTGKSANAGDLLTAIALAITGTYRQVGKSFVLTSDQIGLGARQLRFWTWQTDSFDKLKGLKKTWMKSILEQGRNRSLPVRANDPFREIASTPEANEGAMVSPDLLQGATRQAFVGLGTPGGPSVKVSLIAAPAYAFVLPNGRELEAESQFMMPFRNWPSEIGDPFPLSPPSRIGIGGGGVGQGVAFRFQTPEAATAACSAAKQAGFSEVWLETANRPTLEAAKSSDLPVRLMLEPWRYTKLVLDADRDPLGGTNGKMSLSPELEGESRPFLSPFSSERTALWAAEKDLALTPGLAGLVVAETQPSGYEPQQEGSQDHDPIVRPQLELGYSMPSRESFLNANGCDPIDLNFDVPLDIDIAQPFFPSRVLKKEPAALKGLRAKWNSYRSGLNEQQTGQFLSQLQGASNSILVRLRQISKSLGDTSNVFQAVPWDPAEGVKGLYSAPNVATIDLLDLHFAIQTPKPDAPIIDLSKNPAGSHYIMDLRSVPEKDLPNAIAAWFVSMSK